MNITPEYTRAPSGFGLGGVWEVGDCLLDGSSDQPAKNDFRTPESSFLALGSCNVVFLLGWLRQACEKNRISLFFFNRRQ